MRGHHSEESKRKISESLKGRIAWNRGLRGKEYLKHLKRGKAWNKGLTKETDGRVAENVRKAGLAKRGKPSSFKGKKHTKEAIEKIRKAHMGAKSPNWRGGITPEYFKVHCSSEFRKKRKIILERDNYTCQRCGKPAKCVDIIIPWRVSKNISLNNLQTLCRHCNLSKIQDDKVYR